MIIKKYMKEEQKKKLYRILDMLPDGLVIRLQYWASLGRWPKIKNPLRYTEKLQWYKLNYRVPLMTQCADKYRVREYIAQKGYAEYLPMLYQACECFEDIQFEELPMSFAIKSNNGSGTNCFIKDKSKVDMTELRENVKSWEKVNTISVGREWAYINIKPMIVVEELLVAEDLQQKNDLNDYKFLCFNGQAKYVWVDVDRHVDHRRNFYDMDWNLLPVESDCPQVDYLIPKPYGFEKMIEIANSIAKDFPFVRVDFYSLHQRIYIGELTFYPWSGCVQYKPDDFDFELGNCFVLPKKTIIKE